MNSWFIQSGVELELKIPRKAMLNIKVGMKQLLGLKKNFLIKLTKNGKIRKNLKLNLESIL